MDKEHYNEADKKIRECLKKEGRATPRLISEQTEYSRVYVSQRLDRLVAGHEVEKVDRGLYEWHGTHVVSGPAAYLLDLIEEDCGEQPAARVVTWLFEAQPAYLFEKRSFPVVIKKIVKDVGDFDDQYIEEKKEELMKSEQDERDHGLKPRSC